jgi:deoxyribose-phosphate aldolase
MLNLSEIKEKAEQILCQIENDAKIISYLTIGDISNKKDELSRVDFAKCIDHTVLKADTTRDTIRKFCNEAAKYGFASVCINSVFVEFAAELLKNTTVKVCTVVGFPLGANLTQAKCLEAELSIQLGAEEIDMVMDIGALKNEEYDIVYKDIKALAETTAGRAILKVIIEISILTDTEKVIACLIAKAAGANFVKTSTGFGTGGATIRDVYLMKQTVGKTIQVKASTGVKTREIAERLYLAGAVRFGTSSGANICMVDKLSNGADQY